MLKLALIFLVTANIVNCFNNFDKYLRESKNSGKMNTILRFTLENVKTNECYEYVINDRHYRKCLHEQLQSSESLISVEPSKFEIRMKNFCCTYSKSVMCLKDSVQRVCDPKEFANEDEQKLKWTEKYGSICHAFPLDKVNCYTEAYERLSWALFNGIGSLSAFIIIVYTVILVNYYFLRLDKYIASILRWLNTCRRKQT